MSKQILVDMNLSPDWIALLKANGWPAIHWTSVGDARATDQAIMAWARENDAIVFTHDLDFGTTLALTHAVGPSVIQLRGQEVLPDRASPSVLAALRQYEAELEAGALVVVDTAKARVRILPI